MQKYLLSVIIMICLLFIYVQAASAATAEVVKVHDGDTITVLIDGNHEKVRLYGVDCPELEQPHGKAATSFLAAYLHGKKVSVYATKLDPYGRSVAFVVVGAEMAQEALLDNGLAWVDARYCKVKFCKDWVRKQAQAQKKKLGLWADDEPIEPRHWRKGAR